jgi:hypothetical protein
MESSLESKSAKTVIDCGVSNMYDIGYDIKPESSLHRL